MDPQRRVGILVRPVAHIFQERDAAACGRRTDPFGERIEVERGDRTDGSWASRAVRLDRSCRSAAARSRRSSGSAVGTMLARTAPSAGSCTCRPGLKIRFARDDVVRERIADHPARVRRIGARGQRIVNLVLRRIRQPQQVREVTLRWFALAGTVIDPWIFPGIASLA